MPDSDRPPLLERLCLHTPATRAWALYDWANSAFVTTVLAAVFPIYFSDVVAANMTEAEASRAFGLATTIALLAIALAAPLLGALADYKGIRKRLLGAFLSVAVLATAALFTVERGDVGYGLALFAIANIGAAGSFVFYDSLLPHVAPTGREDQLSTSGYALGYLGGGLLLAVNLAWILKPELFGLPAGDDLEPSQATLPVRLAFLSVALWWAFFSMPLFYNVKEPPRAIEPDESPNQDALRVAAQRLGETFRELKRYRQALTMMIAFLLYNDGISTIIRMAAFLGTQRGLETNSLITAILVVQFVGIPFAILFGRLAKKYGAKRLIGVGVLAYLGITVVAVFMRTELHFFALAIAVGMVQGGTQALSRSLFASMIPEHKSSEFFALFGVLEKFAGIAGPALFTVAAVALPPERSEYAIVTIIPFFIGGLLLLSRVNVREGRRVAREADAATRVLG